jgi:predicted SAM-dependent methyltransferase
MVKQTVHALGIDFHALQLLRHEAHLFAERLRAALWPSRRRQRHICAHARNLKLHFGCGTKVLPGWMNVDGYSGPGVDLVQDLRRPLPFSDESVELIFSEHVLEHFTREDGQAIFREMRRILQPGGTVRIVVPDLHTYCRAVADGDDAAVSIALPHANSPAEAINNVFYGHFHRNMYDFAMLRYDLQAAGFAIVKRCNYGESSIAALAQDADLENRRVASLCVEAMRQSSKVESRTAGAL